MPLTLQQAFVLSLQYPSAFPLLDEALRGTLLPGDCAFLSLTDGYSIERLWVRVTYLLPDGTYSGQLANEPHCFPDLHLGDPLHFQPDHVLAVLDDEATPQGFVRPGWHLAA